MHPDILRQLAAEHTRDLITEAGQARRAREARHAQRRRLAAQLRRSIRLAVLCNVALLGGAALERASHLHGGAPAERLLFGAYLGAVMAHFVIDAGLWRLRDPFPRAFLARHVPSLVPQNRGTT